MLRDIIFAHQRARRSWPSRCVNAALDGQRYAMKRPWRCAAGNRRFGGARLLASALSIEVHKRVQFRLECSHFLKVCIHHFDRRKFLFANSCCNFGNRATNNFVRGHAIKSRWVSTAGQPGPRPGKITLLNSETATRIEARLKDRHGRRAARVSSRPVTRRRQETAVRR